MSSVTAARPSNPASRRGVIGQLILLIAALALFGAACSSTSTVTITTDEAAGAAPIEQSSVDSGSGVESVAPGSQPDVDDPVSSVAASATDAPESAEPSQALADIDVTPAFLAYAAEQVDTATSYRFEMFQETTGSMLDLGSRDVPLMTGAADGSLARMEMDMGTMLGAMLPPSMFGDADLTMRYVIDGSTMYLQAPFLAMIADATGGDAPELAWMQSLATGWGKVDASQLGDNQMLADFGMGQEANADAMLDMLSKVGNVLDGGTGEVRGVPTRIVYATVDLSEATELLGDATADFPVEELEGLPPLSLEVHIDDQSMVRRVAYTIDMGDLIAEAGLSDAKMWMQIDYFAFGEPVDITIPVGAVDITDDLASLSGF